MANLNNGLVHNNLPSPPAEVNINFAELALAKVPHILWDKLRGVAFEWRDPYQIYNGQFTAFEGFTIHLMVNSQAWILDVQMFEAYIFISWKTPLHGYGSLFETTHVNIQLFREALNRKLGK